jgi:transposase
LIFSPFLIHCFFYGLERFGMSIEITRLDLDTRGLREAASREKDVRVARRLFALAFVLEGVNRTTAASNCGMDRQTLCDWVHRYNAEGLEGLRNKPRSGRPPRLNAEQKQAFIELVEAGPNLEQHKVVRWRRKDLRDELSAQFGVELHERTVGKHLKQLGFRRLSVRPQHPKSDAASQEAFKKTSLKS